MAGAARPAWLRAFGLGCGVLAVGCGALGAGVWAVDGDAVTGGTLVVLGVLVVLTHRLVLFMTVQPARMRARRVSGVGVGTPGELSSVPAGAGEIVVHRPRGVPYAVFRRYRVVVDGEPIGEVRRGGTLRRSVAPGPHRVSARIDWSGSPELDVVVPDAGRVLLEVWPSDDPLAGMFTRDRSLSLRQVTRGRSVG